MSVGRRHLNHDGNLNYDWNRMWCNNINPFALSKFDFLCILSPFISFAPALPFYVNSPQAVALFLKSENLFLSKTISFLAGNQEDLRCTIDLSIMGNIKSVAS